MGSAKVLERNVGPKTAGEWEILETHGLPETQRKKISPSQKRTLSQETSVLGPLCHPGMALTKVFFAHTLVSSLVSLFLCSEYLLIPSMLPCCGPCMGPHTCCCQGILMWSWGFLGVLSWCSTCRGARFQQLLRTQGPQTHPYKFSGTSVSLWNGKCKPFQRDRSAAREGHQLPCPRLSQAT